MKYIKYVGGGGGACCFGKIKNDVHGINQQSMYGLTKWEKCTAFSVLNTKYRLHQTRALPAQKNKNKNKNLMPIM